MVSEKIIILFGNHCFFQIVMKRHANKIQKKVKIVGGKCRAWGAETNATAINNAIKQG